MRFATVITVSGQPIIINVPQGRAYGKANSVYVPLGSAHSEAWFIMTKGALDELDLDSAQSISWTQNAITESGTADPANTRTLTFSGWYILTAERLNQGGPDDPNSLYLVELVDARYLYNVNSGTGEQRIGLRSYAQEDDYLTGTTTITTWSGLIQDLWERLSLLGAFPGLPATYAFDGQPEGFNVSGINCWKSLCCALEYWDCAIAHNPLTGTYSIVQLGQAQTVALNTANLKWNSQPITNKVTSVATLYFYFWKHRKSYGQERDTELDNNWAYNGSEQKETSATGITGAIGSKPVWNDLVVEIDETGATTNQAAIDARVSRLTNSYVLREGVESLHKVFSGLISYVLGGQLRAILWRNWNDGNGTQTEILGGSSLHTRSNEKGLSWIDREIMTPHKEFVSTPDLSRRSYPNYPRLPNIVQVVNTGEDPGVLVDPNGDNLHPGKVKRWVDDAMATLEDCWILFVDDYDTLAGNVQAKNYDYYGPARLSGLKHVNTDGRPIYLVRKGEATETLIRFRLTEVLELGEHATAKILTWDGSAWVLGSETIFVYDWFNTLPVEIRTGMFRGEIDYEGWAVFREAADAESQDPEDEFDKYDIVWMENKADWITFELTAKIINQDEPTAARYEISIGGNTHGFSRGRDPNVTTSTIDVYDVTGTFFGALPDAIGIAKYNDRNDHYEIVRCQMPMIRGMATLSSQMCDQSASFTWVSGIGHGEHIMEPDPAPSTGINPCNHKGEPGDTIFIEHDLILDEWRVYDVLKKDTLIPIRVYWDAATGCLMQQRQEIGLEYCEPPLPPEEVICFTPC